MFIAIFLGLKKIREYKPWEHTELQLNFSYRFKLILRLDIHIVLRIDQNNDEYLSSKCRLMPVLVGFEPNYG